MRYLAALGLILMGTGYPAAELPPLVGPEEAQQRREHLVETTREWARQYGMPLRVPSPNYPANYGDPSGDGATAFPLLLSGSPAEIARANQIMPDFGPEPSGNYGLFGLVGAVHAWYMFPDLIEEPARAGLLRGLREGLGPDTRAWGVGGSETTEPSNWQYLACASLILGGQALQDAEIYQRGLQGLRAMSRWFATYGAGLQYNSPTYDAPVQYPLLLLQEYAEDEAVRAEARAHLERWALAQTALLHPPSQRISGPHSRAYHGDLVYAPQTGAAFLYPHLPELTVLDYEASWLAPAYVPGTWPGALGLAPGWYPQPLRLLAYERQYPWRVQMTSEQPETREWRGLRPTYPQRVRDLYSYHTAAYTLGSASGPYHNGAHTETPILYWARRSPVESWRDQGTGFFRFVVDDKMPGQTNSYRTFGDTGLYAFWNEGINATCQHDNRALLLVTPSRMDDRASGLRLSFFVSELGQPVEEVWVGEEQVSSRRRPWESPADLDRRGETPGEPPVVLYHTEAQEPVCLRDGAMYFALIPLPGNTRWPGSRLEVREANGYLEIATVSYAGPERQFDEQSWLGVRSGFYLEAAEAGDYADFAAFREAMAAVTLRDETEGVSRRTVEAEGGDGPPLRVVYDYGTDEWHERSAGDQAFTREAWRCPLAALGQETVRVGDAEVSGPAETTLLLLRDPRFDFTAVQAWHPAPVQVTVTVGERRATLTLTPWETHPVTF